jgi:glycosyltransferase involved in cell wall biosynthesis
MSGNDDRVAGDRRPVVLHVISSLGVLGGGTQRQLLLFLRNQGNRWQHIVVYREPESLLREEFAQAGIQTVWLGRGGFLHHLVRLVRLARTASADLIHTHLYGANWLGRLAGYFLNVPVITTLVSTMEVEDRVSSGAYRQPWKYRLSLALETFSGRWNTSQFIAISEAVKESAMRMLRVPPSRIRVVYRAVEGKPSEDTRALGPGPTLICVGRLIPSKGQDFLIRMLRGLLRHHPQVQLLLVGHGPDRARLEHLANALALTSHVRFLGYRTDVKDLLQRADVFVYASWFEGFGVVTAEATAMGVPVVAVDMPVRREVATPDSVVLVRRDEEAFASAVLRVLQDLPHYRAAARRESALVRERFSVEQFVRGTEAVYAEAMAERKQRSATFAGIGGR